MAALHHGEMRRCPICLKRDTFTRYCAVCDSGNQLSTVELAKLLILKLNEDGVSLKQVLDVIQGAELSKNTAHQRNKRR